jgi:hypothetical protein
MAARFGKVEIIVNLLALSLITVAIALFFNAWSVLRVEESSLDLNQMMPKTDLVHWIDLQIEGAKQKVANLDPGPPPPWYTPSYYLDWAPKAKLYNEAQDVLSRLQKQKRRLLEAGRERTQEARKVWNFGVAPVLHFFLAITIFTVSLRVMLRVALVKGMFRWVKL